MMKRIAFLSLAVAVPALLSMPALAQVAGVTAAVNPEASRTPPGQAVRTVILGDNIVQNEKIDTSGAGLVQILLADGTTFTVGPNSSISIDRFVYNPGAGTAEVTATMTRGVFRFIGGRTSKTEGGVKLNTPVGTVGIRGGMVDINLSPSQAGLLAHFDLLFGNEVTLDGQSGGQRIYSAGYSLWVDALGRFNTGKTPAQWRSQIFQNLAGSGGNGGSPNRPTNEQVAASNVPGANSGNLPQTTRTVPTPRPPVVTVTQPTTPRTFNGPYQGFAAGMADVTRKVGWLTLKYHTPVRNTRPENVSTSFNTDGVPFQGQVDVKSIVTDVEIEVGNDGAPSAYLDNDRYGATGGLKTTFMVSGRSITPFIDGLQDFDLCDNCDFLQWGWWGTEQPGNRLSVYVDDGTWVTGKITSDYNDTHTAGTTATYSGNAVGTLRTDGQNYIATGTMQMGWDFGTRSGSLAINDFGSNIGGDEFDAKNFSYAISDPGSSGGFRQTGIVSANNGSVGTASGAFVSAGTDPVGGVIGNFDRTGFGWTASGVFGGTQTSLTVPEVPTVPNIPSLPSQ